MTECSCPTFTLYGTTNNLVFPKPEWAGATNKITKTVDLFNFWADNNIDTVDKGIDVQPLIIGGTLCVCGIWEGMCFPICFPACFSCALSRWLYDVESSMNNGEEFEINELGDTVNGIYIIKNFTFDTIKGSTNCFKWSLQLERKRDI
jgi:hypothetical protein